MSEENHRDDPTWSYSPIEPGSLIGHYRVEKKLGAGGMGEVYLAEDTSLNRRVALKFLSTFQSGDESFRGRFLREARAVAALDHPNIVVVHEVSEYRERPYIVMQYLPGQSLRDVIRSRLLSPDETIAIALQICRALSTAHAANIIHRDIKPSNIIIDEENRARILDFGLAAFLSRQPKTRPGSLLGTVGYMSPEQARGETADHRSDIFSLGVVIYEMLTGKSPFKRDTEAATLHAIVEDIPEPAARFAAHVPDSLQRAIDRSLEKDPALRYQHVDDLEAELKRVQREMEPAFSGLYGRPAPARSSLRIVATVAVFGAAAAVLLAAMFPFQRRAVLRWIGLASPVVEKHLVVLPFANIGEAPANRAFCDGLIETMTTKLTQMEQFHGAFYVVPANEVRLNDIKTVSHARRAFGVTEAITGSVHQLGDSLRININLVNAKTDRQIASTDIGGAVADAARLLDSTVLKLAHVLEVQLNSEQKRALAGDGTTQPDAYQFYLQGRGYLRDYEKTDNVDSAIALFHHALGKDPGYASAYAGLGEAYRRKYNSLLEPELIDMAELNCRQAIRIDRGLVPAHITLGHILNSTGRYVEAAAEFQQTMVLDSMNHELYRGLAAAYEGLRELDNAETTYRKAIGVKANFWGGYIDLAFFYVRHGRYDDAVDLAHQVADGDPEGYQAWNNVGALYQNLDRCDDARRMYERSLAIEPNYGAYSNLGSLHQLRGDYTEAAGMYEKALRLDDRNYLVWGNLAATYYWTPNRRDSALTIYERAAEMAERQRQVNPRDLYWLSDLGEYYSKLGDRDRAQAIAEQIVSEVPDNIDLIIRAGVIFEELDDRDQALRWIGKALQRGYPVTHLEHIPELQSLKTDARFQEILREIGT